MTWTPKQIATREYAWQKATARGEFTYAQLSADAGIDVKYASALTREWEEEGRVQRVNFVRGRRVTMRVVKDSKGDEARLRADGSLIRKGCPLQNMWRSMRLLPIFSPADIAMHANTEGAEVSEDVAKEYCRRLAAAGYLRVEVKAQPGKRSALYRLIRNSGPKAPTIKRVLAVQDQNNDQLTVLQGRVA